jgi:hypothetical protein
MKKLLALLLAFLMLLSTVVGCSKTGENSSDVSSSDELSTEFEDAENEDEEIVEDEEWEEEEEEEEWEDEEPFEPEEEEDEPVSSKPASTEKIEEEPLTAEELRLERLLIGEDEEFNKDAIYHEGNLARLAKAIKKSKNGEKVTIVCYGNAANTARNSDTTEADSPYSSLIRNWWANTIGPCTVIESGLEHLTSINACMRVEFDVLNYKPDLVLLDFSVQDGISSSAKTNARGYDNLVRRILASETSPAVMTLLLTGAEQNTYTMNPDNANMFVTAAAQHKEVSKWYDIPVIDFEGAVWENFTELVKITTKKEIPLITWQDIALGNNINMNNDGHTILAGAIINFINIALEKVDKISTTIPAIPQETYFGVDKYLNGSFITVSDIIDGAANAKGYSFNMDLDEMEKYEYYYKKRSDTGATTDSLVPNITTYRHYIAADDSEAEKSVATASKYLELTVPKVTNSETYFMLSTGKSVSGAKITNSNIADFAPVSFFYYDENGKMLSKSKAPSSNFSETTEHGKTSAVKIPVGTKKIEIKTYTKSGTIRLLGIGQF